MLENTKRQREIELYNQNQSKKQKVEFGYYGTILFFYHFEFGDVQYTNQKDSIKSNIVNKNDYKYQVGKFVIEWNLFNGVQKMFFTGLEECKWFFEPGVLYAHYYIKNNKKEAEFTKNNHDGSLNTHCYYKNGMKEGEFEDFIYKGTICKHTFYKNDKKNGQYKLRSFDGRYDRDGFYKNGVETDDKDMTIPRFIE